MYRAMGSGAFYMPYYYPKIEDDFENEVHLVWWKTKDELFEMIDKYLHSDDRQIIAAVGNKLVESKHRWKNRVKDLKKIIGYKND